MTSHNGLGPEFGPVECCTEGRFSYQHLENSYLLQGEVGFEHITDDEIDRRENICDVADECDVVNTGVCALKAAGLKEE